MVFWMRRHGAMQSRDMHATLSARLRQRDWWSLFALAAVAIAREGSEIVVFLYGVGSARSGAALYGLAGGAIAGALLAGATFWLLQYGGRVLSWRLFFRVTEAMLLVLAGALVIGAVDRLVSIDALPALQSQLWDSSAVLEDDALGGMASSLLGYRARPSLTSVLSYGLYWVVVAGLLVRSRRAALAAAAAMRSESLPTGR
jgi:high-affinity iron transporter